MLLRRDAYIQGCFYTRVLLHRDAFHKGVLSHTDVDTHTHRCFYSEMLLRAATQVLLHRDAFTQRSFCTQTRGCFYTQVPLHINAFTRSFYTHVLLHRKSFDTEHPLHREACAQILLRGFFFTRKCIYTEAFLKHRQSTDTVTKRNFARISLHRDAFTHRRF